MNLFAIIRNILNTQSEDSKKLTSKQIWELDKHNHINKEVQENLNLTLYNSVSDSSASFLKWRESINESQLKQKQQKKIIGNCEWCGTGYFEDDRNCVQCGHGINVNRKEETEINSGSMTVQEIKNEYWNMIDSGKNIFQTTSNLK